MSTTETSWHSECGKAHGPDWLKWLGHLKDKDYANGLELGTFKGDSAEWMLDNIFTGQHAHYWCVDTFEGSDEHHLAGVDCTMLENETRAKLERFGPRAQVFRSRSSEAMRDFVSRERFDFIYVDAAHDAMNVLRDAVLAFDLLKVGGVLLFDDYEWQVMHEPVDRPKLAIDAFISCYAKQIEILGIGWQVALRKTK